MFIILIVLTSNNAEESMEWSLNVIFFTYEKLVFIICNCYQYIPHQHVSVS